LYGWESRSRVEPGFDRSVSAEAEFMESPRRTIITPSDTGEVNTWIAAAT
jgi:hypothetical protein